MTLALYQASVITVVILAAVYTQEVIGFSTQQLVVLILVVNVTSSVGAFVFGFVQDRIGSVRALTVSLGRWITAVLIAFFADKPADLWITGNLVGQFTPVVYTGEFFGLWSISNRLAAIIGPMSYGLVNFWSGGNHRIAILSTLIFFVAGLGMLITVSEQRERVAALSD